MAEIKSAIELAMERTRNLVMDEEEKKQLARKDLEDRLRATERRFLESMIDREQFLADFRDNIKGDRREKRLILIDLAIQGFETSIDNERLFELLELLGEDAGSDLGKEAKALSAGFGNELKTREAGIRSGIVARLQEMKISGSAVEPNVAVWNEWNDAARDTAAVLKQHFIEWKEKVLAVPA
jgi:hypothetical protein